MRSRLAVSAVLLAGIGLASILVAPRGALAFAAPFSAWALLSVFLLTIPGFLGHRLGRSHALVLPFAFLAFTLAASTFWDYREVSLVALRPRLALVQFWLAPWPLLATFGFQAVGLWLLVRE
ncbi:hypothetical protein BH11ARM2_BH11ARM2_11030 [soil metagenome]